MKLYVIGGVIEYRLFYDDILDDDILIDDFVKRVYEDKSFSFSYHIACYLKFFMNNPNRCIFYTLQSVSFNYKLSKIAGLLGA